MDDLFKIDDFLDNITTGDFQREIIRGRYRDLDTAATLHFIYWMCHRKPGPPNLDDVERMEKEELQLLCEKSCFLYVRPVSEQHTRTAFHSIFQQIWKQWFECMSDVITLHDMISLRFCCGALTLPSNLSLESTLQHHQLALDAVGRRLKNTESRISNWTNAVKHWPCIPPRQIDPLCRAVFLILDGHKNTHGDDTVIVVLTGDDSHLESPLTSEVLRRALFGKRQAQESAASELQTRRIPLKAAVRLVAKWHKLQRSTIQSPAGNTDSVEICYPRDQLHKALQEIETKGIENAWEAKFTLETLALRYCRPQLNQPKCPSRFEVNRLRMSPWNELEPDPILLRGDPTTPMKIPDCLRETLKEEVGKSLAVYTRQNLPAPPQDLFGYRWPFLFPPFDPFKLFHR